MAAVPRDSSTARRKRKAAQQTNAKANTSSHTYDFSQLWAPCIKHKHMGIKDFPTVYLELDVT